MSFVNDSPIIERPAYIDLASTLVGLPIPAKYRGGVQQNIDRAAAMARPLLDLNLDDDVEVAPVFIP